MVEQIPPPSTPLVTKTVFVPCAGLGSRLSEGRRNLPKPLSDLGGIPAVARIIRLYPENWDVVVALGHDEDLVKDGIEALFARDPRRENVSFVHTRSFEMENQGLSHTIISAGQMLANRPFVFHAVDALIEPSGFEYSDWLKNADQLLFAQPMTAGRYRYAKPGENGNLEWGLRDFESFDPGMAYVGVSHIFEWSRFWQRLEEFADDNPESGETLGLQPAQCEFLNLPPGKWFDIGSKPGLTAARKAFPQQRNILAKSEEAIWFLNSDVIKIHRDPLFISGRVERARALAPYVPPIRSFNDHTYSYREVTGTELSKALRDPNFDLEGFFDFMWEFWTAAQSGLVKVSRTVDSAYLEFYRDKTLDRVSQLLERFPFMQDECQINGVRVRELSKACDQIPWETIATITSSRIHGDLHPENILLTQPDRFMLLDWRQDVAGSSGALGDIYYDLGKLAHGFRVDHGVVATGGYSVSDNNEGGISLQIDWGLGKQRGLESFRRRVEGWGLSWHRVLIMESIIYLNIAPLHEPDEYAIFLGYLGRLTAETALDFVPSNLS